MLIELKATYLTVQNLMGSWFKQTVLKIYYIYEMSLFFNLSGSLMILRNYWRILDMIIILWLRFCCNLLILRSTYRNIYRWNEIIISWVCFKILGLQKMCPTKKIIYEKSNNLSGREAVDGCWTWWWAHSCLVASVVSNSGGTYGL